MNKKLIHSFLLFVLIGIYSSLNIPISHAQDTESEPDCIPPTVTIVSIDEETNTMTIEVEDAEGEVSIYAENENGELIDGFPIPLTNGTFEIPYIEGAIYTIEIICPNGKVIHVKMPMPDRVFYVADIMELSNICIDADPLWHVGFLNTTNMPSNIATNFPTYGVDCICRCMNDLYNSPYLPNPLYTSIPFLMQSCHNCRTRVSHQQSTTVISSSTPSSNTTLSQTFKTKSHEIFPKPQLFPIPFSNTLNLKIDIAEDAVVSVKAYTPIGQLRLFREDFFYYGQHHILLDTSNLESGLHFFEIEIDGKKKLIMATKF